MSMRGGFVRLTLLVLGALFVVLLVLGTVQRDGQSLQTQLTDVSHATRTRLRQPPHTTTPPQEPMDKELVQQLEQELPEVDYSFWYLQAKPNHLRLNGTCARYPDPLELQLHNIYWQTFLNANVTFRLFAAYLDNRVAVKEAVVRVLGTADQIGDAFPRTYCQLWYDNNRRPTIVEVSEFVSVWHYSWDHTPHLNYPHLISCPLPEKTAAIPRTVSLVRQPCDQAVNSLRVHYEQPASTTATPPPSGDKLRFGVCVKGFDFPYIDLSERLIEWFELQRLFGASRIYAYMYDVHPKVQRVLDYYQRTGYLQLRPITMANGMPRLRHYQHMLLQERVKVKRLNELIPYNDCFYRNMYRHDYILNVDVDEVIVPLGKQRDWHDVVTGALNPPSAKCADGYAEMCFFNAYFTNVVPEPHNHEQLEADDELYVLQHTMRLANYSLPGRATKCFHNTRYSVALHNHYTLKWLPPVCRTRLMETELAHMQHYREPDNNYTMDNLVEDRSVWKYATKLRQQVEYVWLHMEDANEQMELEEQKALHELVEEEAEQEKMEEEVEEESQIAQS
ncbi:uncharacterized protein LOC115627908 [Scaptodrosophila lebanonensis]|uniref:Glycosyltransferase family 92 protein n=1 Tax=Drosophila lebanonensis TaxID=7225 RepID=A0A6J2TWX0_DROLE|nr:uncharacterized protein LOC115627908 [Scaptodrosophila lebanonensis]